MTLYIHNSLSKCGLHKKMLQPWCIKQAKDVFIFLILFPFCNWQYCNHVYIGLMTILLEIKIINHWIISFIASGINFQISLKARCVILAYFMRQAKCMTTNYFNIKLVWCCNATWFLNVNLYFVDLVEMVSQYTAWNLEALVSL